MRSCFYLLLLLALVAHALAQEPAPQPVKLNVPDEASQASAERTVKQVFKLEYSRTGILDRRALAKVLLRNARDAKNEPATRFVMLRESRSLAAGSGDVTTMLEAIDEAAKAFTFDATEAKANLASLAARNIDDPKQAVQFLGAAVALVNHYTAALDFQAAGKLLQPISTVAAKTRNEAIIGAVRTRLAQIRELQTEHDRLKLAINRPPPNDPNGDIAAGRFACFFAKDWHYGLERFARCGDAKLKELAAQDLANPKVTAARVALANAWWEYGQKQSTVAKRMFESRAAHWYLLALPDMPSLEATLAQKRVIAARGAPADAHYFQGHAYAPSPAKLNWHEAKLVCELVGGHLACIESREEQDFVESIFNRRNMWIGATDEEEEGKWKWVNGAPFEFKAWYPGEPNDADGGEHYMNLHHRAIWNDTRNIANGHGFLCEWE